MPWWGDVLFALAVLTAIWGFISLVGFRTKFITSKTDRRAEDLYGDYADTNSGKRGPAADRRHR